jgi:hypothetical protein
LNITLNKTKTLIPTYRVGTAISQNDTWQLIDELEDESYGDGWQWMALTHAVTEEEAVEANLPRTAEAILVEQAVLITLMDGLSEENKVTAQDEVDETNIAIEAADMVAAEAHEGILRTLVRENLLYLSDE